MNKIKIFILLALYAVCTSIYAAPFADSDPTTQAVTACAVYLDDIAPYDSPVLPNGSCHIDLKDATPGEHKIKAKYVRTDTWGRVESTNFSNVVSFTRAALTIDATPTNLIITSQP